MKSAGILLLVGLLTLWMERPAASGQQPVKRGTCPPDNIRCMQEYASQCATDFECRRKQKCCHSFCAMRCVNPVKGIYGHPRTCPPDIIRCVLAKPNECARDPDCNTNQMCCCSRCARHRVYPAQA